MSKSNLPAVKIRRYRLWTYDVWGNARDGFDVNDRYSHGYVDIVCKRETFNVGTPNEFHTWEPTDRQLSRAAGFKGVAWDGQEGSYHAEVSRNGRPIGELDEEDRPELAAEREQARTKYLVDMEAANARQRARESGGQS